MIADKALKLTEVEVPFTEADDDVDDFTEEEKRRIDEGMEAAGWKAVTIAEFLDLTPEDMALIEVRRSLARALRERRESAGITQKQLAKKIGSSQSRVAFIEGNSSSVSLDLMVRAFLATGANQSDLSRALDCVEAERVV